MYISLGSKPELSVLQVPEPFYDKDKSRIRVENKGDVKVLEPNSRQRRNIVSRDASTTTRSHVLEGLIECFYTSPDSKIHKCIPKTPLTRARCISI